MEILKETGITDRLTCLLRNLYAGQEATVRTGHGITDWFKIRKVVYQGYILSPCLNIGLDKSQAGIKIVRTNTNNLRNADNTVLMAESEKELKNLLTMMKEESEKAGLKFNIQKIKVTSSSPITSWQIDGRKMETVRDFIILGSKITSDGDCSHEMKRHLFLGRKIMTNLDSILKSCLLNFA